MKIKYIFIFFLLFVGCKKNNNELLENCYGKITDMEKVQLKIPLTDEELSSYLIHCSYKDSDSNEFFYAYNDYLHSLDVFDLKNKSVSQIHLKEEGENGVLKPVSGLYVQHPDGVWLYSQGLLYLCDHVGNVRRSLKLPFPDDGFIFVNTNFSISTAKIYYHRFRNSVFYLTVSKKDAKTSFFVYEYFPDTGEYHIYPVEGNRMENGISSNYGWMQMPNVTYSDKYIIYNFPITSNVYRIDIMNGSVKSFGGQSRYTDNLVSKLSMPYDFPKGNRHILENVHFFEVEYSPEEHVYYRLHLNKIEASTDDKFRELYSNKDVYLTIFDADFNILNEIELDSLTYGYFNCWGTLSKGFYIVRDNEADSDKEQNLLEMDVFRVR